MSCFAQPEVPEVMPDVFENVTLIELRVELEKREFFERTFHPIPHPELWSAAFAKLLVLQITNAVIPATVIIELKSLFLAI